MPRRTPSRFVIQKHDASSLHYDFRLEVNGVLKSWAIPKGPSLDPREKRLAVQVEDHQLDYYDFEGVIAEGYGEGTVLVWDKGTYRNLDENRSMTEALDSGHVKVWLEGEKLTGGWTLAANAGWLQTAVVADQAARRGSRRPAQSGEHGARFSHDRPLARADRGQRRGRSVIARAARVRRLSWSSWSN
jgi:DNA ligase D-like protein (predicted 3'-phosphoesterase)